ncbi:hypothetical protein G4228_018460, partial [Cervus hanglu yarkandensis]
QHEKLIHELEEERHLRLQSEKRLQEVTLESERNRIQMRGLQQQFSRLKFVELSYLFFTDGFSEYLSKFSTCEAQHPTPKSSCNSCHFEACKEASQAPYHSLDECSCHRQGCQLVFCSLPQVFGSLFSIHSSTVDMVLNAVSLLLLRIH